jgi:signal transduction histidine kinase
VEHEQVRTTSDHDRIAGELHDRVIQQIFAVGMGLQGMVVDLPRADQRARVNAYVETLDRTIAEIRRTVFGLRPAARAEDD